MNRQTITYERLSKLMYGKTAAGVLAQVLGHIAFYCKDHQLPLLTALVIVKGVGRPGDRIPVSPASVDEERENVYGYDWYDVYPPSEAELSAAYVKLHRPALHP